MALEGYIVYEETVKYRVLKNKQGLFTAEINQNGEEWELLGTYLTIQEAKDFIEEFKR